MPILCLDALPTAIPQLFNLVPLNYLPEAMFSYCSGMYVSVLKFLSVKPGKQVVQIVSERMIKIAVVCLSLVFEESSLRSLTAVCSRYVVFLLALLSANLAAIGKLGA